MHIFLGWEFNDCVYIATGKLYKIKQFMRRSVSRLTYGRTTFIQRACRRFEKYYEQRLVIDYKFQD